MSYVLKTSKYSSHNQIAKMIASSSRVLDVGCSSGQIGSLLVKGTYIVGIDSNKKDLEKNNYNKKILCDIEKEDPNLNEKFDCVVFADVLEHTRNPEKILFSYKKYLEKGGKAIISLPNAANVYVRLKLLFGSFDYQERGLLDKTHVKFFTLKSAKKFIEETGFKIDKIKTTPIPVELIGNYGIFSKLFYIAASLWPKLFGYQFIFRISPK